MDIFNFSMQWIIYNFVLREVIDVSNPARLAFLDQNMSEI